MYEVIVILKALTEVAGVAFLGEKGIGRLSAMRLGDTLRVETAKKTDRHLNCLDIDWSAFAQIDERFQLRLLGG